MYIPFWLIIVVAIGVILYVYHSKKILKDHDDAQLIARVQLKRELLADHGADLLAVIVSEWAIPAMSDRRDQNEAKNDLSHELHKKWSRLSEEKMNLDFGYAENTRWNDLGDPIPSIKPAEATRTRLIRSYVEHFNSILENDKLRSDYELRNSVQALGGWIEKLNPDIEASKAWKATRKKWQESANEDSMRRSDR